MPLVFAYGSNLHWDQMIDRCPSAKVVGAAALAGFRLAFVGHSRRWGGAVATVIESTDNLVAGMVYRISRADLLKLDGFEGAPRYYRREPCDVIMLGTDESLEVDTYILARDFAAPSAEYVETIRRGFKRWGFDPRWLKNAVRFSKRREESARKRREKQAREHEAELRSALRVAANLGRKHGLHSPRLLLEANPDAVPYGDAYNAALEDAARESRSTGRAWWLRFTSDVGRSRQPSEFGRKARKR